MQVSYRLRRLFLFLSEKPPVRSLHCASSPQKALPSQTFSEAPRFFKLHIACSDFFIIFKNVNVQPVCCFPHKDFAYENLFKDFFHLPHT